MNRFFLIDAMALIYRAYFALQKNPRITSYGKNTNASFGFTNTLLDILKNHNPTHIAVAFDSYEPTEREINFSDYKANRQAAPEELIDSLDDIKKIIQGFNIPIFEVPGYEADDIIGTIALELHPQKDIEVYMVTPDKDYGQLVRDNVFMLKPPFMGKGFEKLDEASICARWNLASVHQVIDMLALMGDSSDNIPGIPGVGEKTASKLLQTYGNLETVLEKAEEIPGAMGNKVRAGKESALTSKYLATIITDVPLDFSIEKCILKEYDYVGLEEVFSQLEFQTIAKRVLPKNKSTKQLSFFTADGTQDENTINTIHTVKHNYYLVDTAGYLDTLLDKMKEADAICIDAETTGLDVHTCDILGISICLQAFEAYYIDLSNTHTQSFFLSKIQSALATMSPLWIGHNLKFDLLVLKQYEMHLHGNYFDTMIAKYLLGDNGKKTMDAMSVQYLNYQPILFDALFEEQDKQKNLSSIDKNVLKDYAAEDADITFQLYTYLAPLLKEKSLDTLFESIEMPLMPILCSMEAQGVKIDSDFLNQYAKTLGLELNQIKEKIFEYSGMHFNIASPKQLGEVLFDKLQLESSSKKTKSKNRSTGEEVLQKLINEHPIIPLILEYREIAKLKSTYVDTFPKMVKENTGHIHTSFNQTIVVTGRLSSQNPNLQNIPIRTERGKKMRQAFVARNENYRLLSIDYSQIELRVIAAMSGDKNMCQAFIEDKDIHTATAAAVYGIAENEVTAEMRYSAKSVNFGIIYGQGAWGLANNLHISVAEAKSLIDSYFEQYPHIKNYMNEQITFARKNGFVKTLKGRIRYIDNIQSNNHNVRGFAERNAINTPIQGTAADMIKIAMIDIHHTLSQLNLESKLILQVHDELIIDAHISELKEVTAMATNKMVNAMPLPNNVPIKVSSGIGENWLESH